MTTYAEAFSPLRNSLSPLLRLCKGAGLLLPCCLLLLAEARAQSQEDLQNLLFEAVVIGLEPVPGEADGPPQVRELSSLPRSAAPEDLRGWLQRQSAQAEQAEAELQLRIEDYQGLIVELEQAGGPYQPALSENLLALGSALQARGDHPQAITIFERAWHINRVNGGLFNLEQESIVKKLILSHLALGDLERADEQHEYLFFIQQKTHGAGNPALLQSLTELAEWNIYAYNLQAGAPLRDMPYSALGLRAAPMDSEMRQNFLTHHLLNAQTLYRAIIQILLNSAGVSDPRLLDAEKRLALTNYFFAKNYALVGGGVQHFHTGFPSASAASLLGVQTSAPPLSSLGYRHGREALERRVDYLRDRDSVEVEALATAILDLGDWQLLFGKRVQAMETYREAWQLLESAGMAPESLLNPALPVALPTFILGSHTRAARGIPEDLPLRYKGYVDLRLSLNAWGLTQSVDILGRSESSTESIEDRLLSQVKRLQYRPRFVNGEPPDENVALLRYYFTY